MNKSISPLPVDPNRSRSGLQDRGKAYSDHEFLKIVEMSLTLTFSVHKPTQIQRALIGSRSPRGLRTAIFSQE